MTRSSLALVGPHSVCASATKSDFQNGRSDKEPGAVGMGNRRSIPGRRNKGGHGMRTATSARRQPNLVSQPINVEIDEKQAAESFAAAVIHFDAYTLARAAGRDIETARLWKAGRRAPNSTSLINMGRTIREVQDWVNGEMDSRRPQIPLTPHAANAALALLQQEAFEPGERGARAREMLAQLSRGA